ncbi:flagellar export chaperone FliS [Paenibacillus ihuae]|uniref:flagellar export chaperone FliS n=1 Tax=Paenibacillus ihuae TaxID=1232431 RepID=UPI0006D538D3|nr:flagellar export chaperone FliS [Paenibacillus ihuae]
MIKSPYEKYRQSAVQTSTPAQLVLMLYDGAIRFVRAGMDGLEKNDYEKANTNLGKAQTIISELMSTLNYSYDVSNNLFTMYEYTNFLLVEANIRKDKTKAEEALGYLTEIRETWLQASKIAAGQSPESTSMESTNG